MAEQLSSKTPDLGPSFKELLPGAGASPEPGAGRGPAPAADVDLGPTAQPSQSGFKDFSSASVVEGSKDFLESNSWVAKLAFLLMVGRPLLRCSSLIALLLLRVPKTAVW